MSFLAIEARCTPFRGSNFDASLLDGDVASDRTDLPDPCVGNTSGVLKISAGDFHTCAQMGDGTLCCWGENVNGQLGVPPLHMRSDPRPSPIAVHPAVHAAIASAGGQHTCVRTAGQVLCWGENAYGQLGTASPRGLVSDPQTVDVPASGEDLFAGVHHSCAIDSSSGAWCWGRNDEGQLGIGSFGTAELAHPTPARTESTSGVPLAAVREIYPGYSSTCAHVVVGGIGRVRCWGGNNRGQLGDGTTNARHYADTDVALPVGFDAAHISLRYWHVCAHDVARGVYCWGANDAGQLGDGHAGPGSQSSAPVQVAFAGVVDPALIRRIATGWGHTCASTGSDVYCWGLDDAGQLGTASPDMNAHPTPQRVSLLPAGITIDQLVTGWSHTCILTGDSRVFCWGNNAQGQAGTGDIAASVPPTLVRF